MQWTTFQDYYSSTIDNNNSLRTLDKFNMLVSLLQGKARSTIEYLPRRKDVYAQTVDISKERFGEEEFNQHAVYQQLRNIPRAVEAVASLRVTVDEIDKTLQQARGIEGMIDQTAIVMILQDKVPKDIALEIVRAKLNMRKRVELREVNEVITRNN